MKKYSIFPIMLLLGLTCLNADAQTRGRQNSGNGNSTAVQKQAATTARPAASATSARPAATTATPRPATGTATARPSTGTATRPSGNNSSATQRPGGSAATTPRPGGNTSTVTPPPSGNNNNATQRPGSGNVSGQRPGSNNNGASQRPGTPNVRPTTPPPPQNPPHVSHPAPPTSYHPGYNYRPPRPYTPPTFHYYRPTPPPSWRPPVGAPGFNSILGITLGTIMSNAVNALFNQGYHVAGYTPNEVYLNNVNYCNVIWPNATMFYDNGLLRGSVFSNSTLSYDYSRYNYVYSYLTSMYGPPVSMQSLAGGGMSSTWWGSGNTYITLSFYPEYVNGVGTRYFTTLSTGY